MKTAVQPTGNGEGEQKKTYLQAIIRVEPHPIAGPLKRINMEPIGKVTPFGRYPAIDTFEQVGNGART